MGIRITASRSAGGFVFFIVLCLAVVGGWIANIVKLVGLAYITDPNYVMAALRIAGIFVPPLGVVLGYL